MPSAILALMLILQGCVSLGTQEETLTEEARAKNLESFDLLWTTVHEKVWDTTFNDLDWEARGTYYRPLVAQAKTVNESRAQMQTMLNELELSHLNLIPAEVYDDLDTKANTENADKGSRRHQDWLRADWFGFGRVQR